MIRMTETAIVAIIVALISTMGVKSLEWAFSRIRTKEQQVAAIRKELEAENDKVEQELKEIKAQLEEWRMRYYDLRDERSRLEGELKIALSQIEGYERDIKPHSQS